MIRKKVNGAWTAFPDVKRKTDGVWTDCTGIQRYTDAKWTQVWYRYKNTWRIKGSYNSLAYEEGFTTHDMTLAPNGPMTINLYHADHSGGDYGYGSVINVFYAYYGTTVNPGESVYFDYSYTTNYPTSSSQYNITAGTADEIGNGATVRIGTGSSVSLKSQMSGIAKVTNNRSAMWQNYIFIMASHSWDPYTTTPISATITINKIYTDSMRVLW